MEWVFAARVRRLTASASVLMVPFSKDFQYKRVITLIYFGSLVKRENYYLMIFYRVMMELCDGNFNKFRAMNRK